MFSITKLPWEKCHTCLCTLSFCWSKDGINLRMFMQVRCFLEPASSASIKWTVLCRLLRWCSWTSICIWSHCHCLACRVTSPAGRPGPCTSSRPLSWCTPGSSHTNLQCQLCSQQNLECSRHFDESYSTYSLCALPCGPSPQRSSPSCSSTVWWRSMWRRTQRRRFSVGLVCRLPVAAVTFDCLRLPLALCSPSTELSWIPRLPRAYPVQR